MKRTVSTPHLILGIIFAGLATLWFVGQATDAKFHDTAPGFPLVLIGAGVVGLVASLTNARTRSRDLETASDVDEVEADEPELDEPETDPNEPTTVIEENR